jgi:hypothetical protein
MNFFVLYLWAKIGLKYDGRALPKIEKNGFPASEQTSGEGKHCHGSQRSSQQSAFSNQPKPRATATTRARAKPTAKG